jgi:HSP20 family protein
MAKIFADPFDALLQFQQALDSFRTSGWLSTGPSARGAYPPINIFRKGDDLVAIAEVPGIQKSDLEIQVVGRTIRIAR